MTQTIRSIVFSALLFMQMSSVMADSSLLDLSKYQGKAVYLDFWASWCQPCKKSFPWMQEMHSKYAEQGLHIIAVNLDEDAADADRFLKQYPVDFEIIRDPDATLVEQFALKGMPTAFLFDTGGKLVSRHIGFSKKKQAKYEAEIIKLVAGVNQSAKVNP